MMDEPIGFTKYLKEKYKNQPTKQNLHPNTVRAIRHRLAEGQTVKYIALDMELGLNVIYNIKNGLTYRRVV